MCGKPSFYAVSPESKQGVVGESGADGDWSGGIMASCVSRSSSVAGVPLVHHACSQCLQQSGQAALYGRVNSMRRLGTDCGWHLRWLKTAP